MTQNLSTVGIILWVYISWIFNPEWKGIEHGIQLHTKLRHCNWRIHLCPHFFSLCGPPAKLRSLYVGGVHFMGRQTAVVARWGGEYSTYRNPPSLSITAACHTGATSLVKSNRPTVQLNLKRHHELCDFAFSLMRIRNGQGSPKTCPCAHSELTQERNRRGLLHCNELIGPQSRLVGGTLRWCVEVFRQNPRVVWSNR